MLLSYNVTANVSVASTTLTGAYGMYFYSVTASHQYKWVGIYFGGTGYTTVSGTFAVTWASGIVATINCAANT